MVFDAAEVQKSHYDFIIFGPGCTEFVRVKRIRTHVTDPQEIAKIFGEDVLQIRRVPKTPVVSREIWVLSPWNSWQYFLVLDARIIEIRRDGTPVLPAMPAAGERPAPTNPAPSITGDAPAMSSMAGFTSPAPMVTPG
ncbi:MAG: hypothetical protein NTW33_09815 [Methanoregula sp.]|nr:hypothetical protein [Methanoregula sp.]